MTWDRTWLGRAGIPLALAAFFGFFFLYNRFILDVNLQNLRTSLSILGNATGVGQAEAALVLVDLALVAEMARTDVDLKTLATLQYTQGTLAFGSSRRPVEDAQIMMAALAEERAVARPGWLTALDGAVSKVQATFRQGTLFPRRAAPGTWTSEIDAARLNQATQLERLGKFSEAAEAYEQLLKAYPTYLGRTGLKLRLGYVYQRSKKIDQAEKLYREVSQESRNPQEIEVAHQMLSRLVLSYAQKGEVKALEQYLSTLGPGPEQQRAAFELGSVLIRSYAMEEAAKAFHQAVEAAPQGALALPSLFKEAWCLKYLGRLEEALERYRQILEKEPKGVWAAASQHQIAELYKATGDYPSAALAYEQAIAKTSDQALQALIQVQTGSIYRYDLKNLEQAKAHFKLLSDRFVSSPFGAVEKQLEQMETAKTSRITPPPGSLTTGIPIVTWLQGFLPNFAGVFSERLARYMKAAGLRTLTRRYTEDEFRELVVRRIQERFPGQVTDIETEIHPGGFYGSGTVHLGPLSFPTEGRVGIQIVDEQPHVEINEIKVGTLAAPDWLRRFMETQVNEAIDQEAPLLKIKRYELGEGWALISIELVG